MKCNSWERHSAPTRPSRRGFIAASAERTWIRLALLAAAVVLLAGCLAQAHPKKSYFVLETRLPDTQVNTAKRRTLLIGTVSAAAGYDGRGLVYRVGPDQFDTDFYNEFMAPPARLLADQCAQYLDASSRRVRAVKTPGLALADYGLETYLETMHGDFTTGPPQAVLAIRFTVNDLRRAPTRVLLDKTYRSAAPLAAKTPEALVTALNGCLEAILAELSGDLDKAVR